MQNAKCHNNWLLLVNAAICLSCAGTEETGLSEMGSAAMAAPGAAAMPSASVAASQPEIPPPPKTDEPIIEDTEPVVINEDPRETECASTGVESIIPPVNLLFAIDVSSSMRRGGGVMYWDPVVAALKSFAVAPESEGLNAALQLFPSRRESLTGARRGCGVELYLEADFPLTPLPDTGSFALFIDAVAPNGSTPTTMVLQGLIQQAEAAMLAAPETRVAIVLVSDGNPAMTCRGEVANTVETAAAAVSAVADRIPTYVIGVGDSLENLNTIAEAGGTTSALLVDVADAELTRMAILERLNEIRGTIASCDVAIPAPPEGKMLEPAKVTAQIRDAAGAIIEVPYEVDCASGLGFHYDNLDAPTTINLCPQACSALRTDGMSLEVVFGCAFNPAIAK